LEFHFIKKNEAVVELPEVAVGAQPLKKRLLIHQQPPSTAGRISTNSRRRSSCKNAWMELRLQWGFGFFKLRGTPPNLVVF